MIKATNKLKKGKKEEKKGREERIRSFIKEYHKRPYFAI
jgi:hypothetical protein